MSALCTPSFAEVLAISRSHGAIAEQPFLWDDLMGFWHGVQGGGERWYDLSGRDQTATLTSMDPESDWAVGEKGYQLDLDGTLDYISASLGNFTDPDICTLMVLAKASNTGVRQTIIGRNNVSNAVQLEFRGGDVVAVLVAGTFIAQSSIDFLVSDDTWHHIVYRSWGGSSGQQEIWIDGQNTTLDTDAAHTYANSSTLEFGRRASGSQLLTGSLATIAIYDRAITPSEIQQHYLDDLALLRLRSRVFPVVAAPPAGTILPQLMQLSN